MNSTEDCREGPGWGKFHNALYLKCTSVYLTYSRELALFSKKVCEYNLSVK